MAVLQDNTTLYRRFLDAMNAPDYGAIDDVMADSFVDHHPGFHVEGRDGYKQALQMAHSALDIRAELNSILAVDDRVVTMATLTGRHVGSIFDQPPTGRQVSWTTTEVWRVENGRLAERWAEDDLWGLMRQLSPDEENVGIVRHLREIVNGRRYEEMDALFSASFVDHNPAWSVKGLSDLKGIISAAHDALDMQITEDQLFPAPGGRVVLSITFNGHHVGEFMGRQPTGKAVSWTSIEVYRLENGKIAERWVQADTAGLMRQLGVPLP